jgi:hypothetical protein
LADSLQTLCEAVITNEPEVKEMPTTSKSKSKSQEPQLSLEDVRAVLAKKKQAGKTEFPEGLYVGVKFFSNFFTNKKELT